MDTTAALIKGINDIPQLKILGRPDMSVFAFASDSLDIYAVADALDEAGWHPDRQQLPPSLHCMVTPVHDKIVETFLPDLRRATAYVAENGDVSTGRAATYGMLDKMPDRAAVRNVVLDSIDRLTQARRDSSARD